MTPKITTKAVIHGTHDASLPSSGSHSVPSDRVVTPSRIDHHNDTHSMDSSLSGSHSLHSPKLDGTRKSREGTPEVEDEEEGAVLHEESTADAVRGASFLVTNAEYIATNSHILSANQNVHGNGNIFSVDARPFSGGGGGVCVSCSGGGGSSDVCNHNGEISVTKTDISFGGKSRDMCSPLHHTTKIVSHTKDGKKVMFADDPQRSVTTSESSVSLTEQKESTNQAEKFVDMENKEISMDLCFTEHMESSPKKEVPNSVKNTQFSVKRDIVEDGCITTDFSESVEVNLTMVSSVQETSDKNICADDLIEDIPYYLERRLYDNGVADVPKTKSPPPFIRRGRSSKKRRPNNMQIEHVKVCEGGGESQSRNNSPVSRRPSNITGKKCSKSVSPLGRSSFSPRYFSKTSLERLERYPSCNRMVEIVNVHKLPSKDSYSSVDDTTSPTLEKDVIKHIQKRGILSKSLSFKEGERSVKVRLTNLMKSSSFHGEKDVKTRIPNGGVGFTSEHDNLKVKQKMSNGKVKTQVDQGMVKQEKSDDLPTGSEKDGVISQTSTLDKNPVGDICEERRQGEGELSESVHRGIDQPSQAIAYLILNKTPPLKEPHSKNITFSTFKPANSTLHCAPSTKEVGDSESDDKSNYGSLPSSKHADSKKPLQIPVQPDNVIFRPTNSETIPVQPVRDNIDSNVYGPHRPRKVSFHRERGYKYSFESVNDPPAFALTEPIVNIHDIGTENQTPSKSESTDVLDILECLEDEAIMETDSSSSCNSSTDSDGMSEQTSSDEESHKHDDFLMFAKSLANSGKETTIGLVTQGEEQVPAPNNGQDAKKSSEENIKGKDLPVPNEKNIDLLIRRSMSDSSLSSLEFDNSDLQDGRRQSLDPLDDLENPSIAEVFSDSSGEEEEAKGGGGGGVIPSLTFTLPSSPDASSPSSKENEDNEFGSSFC